MTNLPSKFEAVKGRPGWYRSPSGDCPALEAEALKLHKKFAQPNQVVCGAMEGDHGFCIYIVEDASPVEIAKQFETGSQTMSPAETDRLCQEISRVFKIAPFRPYYVNPAGYKAKFLDRITVKQAKAIEQILTVGQDGYEPELLDGEWGIAATLIKENGLRLWWD